MIDSLVYSHLFTSKRQQVRVFGDHYISYTFSDEVGKLSVCFIWSHNHFHSFLATRLQNPQRFTLVYHINKYVIHGNLDKCQCHVWCDINTLLKTAVSIGCFTLLQQSFTLLEIVFSPPFRTERGVTKEKEKERTHQCGTDRQSLTLYVPSLWRPLMANWIHRTQQLV